MLPKKGIEQLSPPKVSRLDRFAREDYWNQIESSLFVDSNLG